MCFYVVSSIILFDVSFITLLKIFCLILSLLCHSYTHRLSLSYDLSISLSSFPYISLFPLTLFFFLVILKLSSKLRVWSNPTNYVNILYFIVGLSDVRLKREPSSRWTFFYSSTKKWPHIELFRESNFTIYAYTFSTISWMASIVYMIIKWSYNDNWAEQWKYSQRLTLYDRKFLAFFRSHAEN